MAKNNKIILAISIIIAGIIVYTVVSTWMSGITNGKPNGPYYSSQSIKEATKDHVWIATFLPTEEKYYSSEKKEVYEINEVWVEMNKNDRKIHRQESKYDNILNVSYKHLTKNDLHEFRLIPDRHSRFNQSEQRQHPDGYQRVRFLLNDINDTIKLEVIERNPSDRLAWMTEKVIDTIVLIRKN